MGDTFIGEGNVCQMLERRHNKPLRPSEKYREMAEAVCPVCNGTGKRPGVPDFEGEDRVVTQSQCDCEGTGRRWPMLVRKCIEWGYIGNAKVRCAHGVLRTVASSLRYEEGQALGDCGTCLATGYVPVEPSLEVLTQGFYTMYSKVCSIIMTHNKRTGTPQVRLEDEDVLEITCGTGGSHLEALIDAVYTAWKEGL